MNQILVSGYFLSLASTNFQLVRTAENFKYLSALQSIDKLCADGNITSKTGLCATINCLGVAQRAGREARDFSMPAKCYPFVR